jgi:hypothetical protein
MPAFIVADFSIIIFALGLFIFFWAALPLIVATGEGIAAIVRGFPAIGDDLADWIRARTHDVERTVQNTMESAVHGGTQPFVDLMNGYANTRRVESYSQRNVMQNIVGMLAQVNHAQQHQVTQPVVDTVNHTVTNNVENTNNYITQVVGVTQQYVDDSYTQLAGWAEGAISAVSDDVTSADTAINALGSWTEGQISDANTYALSVSERAKADAVSAANDYTDAAFGTLETYVSQSVDWVQSTVAGTVDTLEGFTTGAINANEAKVAGEIAGMGALVATAVATFEDFMNNCGEPMCNSALPFFRGMESLVDLLSLGALFGLVVEAVTDPEGTGKAIAHEVEAVTELPRGMFHTITGLG